MMRSILLTLATVVAAELPPAFPPFAHNDSEAYVYRDEIIDHNAKRLERFRPKGRALQEISGALARGDFTWNALGIAFRRGFRHSQAPTLVKELLLWSKRADDVVLKLDVDEPSPSSNADARHMDASGYALIDDWGLGEDRMRRLSTLANEALALERKGHTKPEKQD